MLARAYADDTAIVTDDIWRDGPKLMQIFEEFASFSGLCLNFQKSVVIPLSTKPLNDFRGQLVAKRPMWREMQVSSSGTYLGFAVGPGKMDKSWTRAAEKYRERVAIWENQPLGL